jgi:hypothetical protein
MEMKGLLQLLIVLLAMFLSACTITRSLTGTVVPSLTPHTSATEIASPVPSLPPATGTPQERLPLPIVYYYFVAVAGNTFPAGSVVIQPDVLILAPTLSKSARSPDTITNIGSALQAMIQDPRSPWKSDDLGISNITFSKGSAAVMMQGKIIGTGDVVLIAARMQILMTVFAEASVQTATVTLNGENIANLGISHGSESKPASYAYTRAEIETFMTKNTYKVSTTTATPPLATRATLIPADSDSPASGICAQAEGQWATVEITPDVPAPRCVKISGDQRLKVINKTQSMIRVSLGEFVLDLQPGSEGTLDKQFKDYLEPGVHRVLSTPFSGPELWLVEK